MIQIESLSIDNFRGIKRLSLNLERRNFAICGPNGTGKSGVVDAIEFALTGSVTRLSGRGTGGVSVKQHGPHVDLRDQPNKATVRLTAYSPKLRKKFSIERKLSAPNRPTISPSDPDIVGLMSALSEHPELALSRREILKYVIVEPGERSKEVQALLKLEDVEKLRAILTKINNSCGSEQKQAQAAMDAARSQFLAALKIDQVQTASVLQAVNERRLVLGLAPLTEVTRDTSFKAGLADAGAGSTTTVKKATALLDVASVEAVMFAAPEPAQISASTTANLLRRLHDNPKLLRSLRRRVFLTEGLDLLEDALCPFCETEWDVEELRHQVAVRVAQGTEAETIKRQIDQASRPLLSECRRLQALLNNLAGHAQTLDPTIDCAALVEWCAGIQELGDRISNSEQIAGTMNILERDWRRIPSMAALLLAQLRGRFEALPNTTKVEDAKEFLIVGQERFEAYQKAQRHLAMLKKQTDLTAKVAAIYGEAITATLTGLYHDVERDFSRFYALINREDEADFSAKLIPSMGKLGFEVDFYGRGHFPPGAYHSEGHQDGMGLCLYLALMRRLLGGDFNFAVLDDVLMSVDAGHRKEVCRLLKTEFPDTQFVFTTHDEIWLQHMKAEELVPRGSALQFRKWTVDDGPHVWQIEDVWAEITRDLEMNDVPGAAHTLRRYLEYAGSDLSARFRAQIEYRPGSGYDLGELWGAVLSRWNDLLAKAKAAAQSWKQQDEFELLKRRHDEFTGRVAKSKVDQWELNALVHYNEWATLQKEDFLPVAKAFRALLECFRCDHCGGLLYVSPPRGTVEMLRCDCSKTTVNLKKK